MGAIIEELDIGGAGTSFDKTLGLTNCNAVRAMSIGSNWNEIALLAGISVHNNTATPTVGTRLFFGFSSAGDAYDSGSGFHVGINIYSASAAWDFQRPYSATNAGGYKAPSTTVTAHGDGVQLAASSAYAGNGSLFCFASKTAVESNTYVYDGKWHGLILFLRRNGGNIEYDFVRSRNISSSGIYAGPTVGSSFTRANLLLAAETGSASACAAQIGASNSEGSGGLATKSGNGSVSFATLIAESNEATYGELDSVCIHWNRSSSQIHLHDVIVAKWS